MTFSLILIVFCLSRLKGDTNVQIQKQLQEVRRMSTASFFLIVDEKELTDKERVQKWLEERVKLPQYYELFINQGFEDLDSIRDITKEDLNQMGIDKIGHQRKILSNSIGIRTRHDYNYAPSQLGLGSQLGYGGYGGY